MYVVPVTVTFLAISIVIVIVRLYTRLWFVRTAGWDDLVIGFALLAEIGLFVCVMIEVRHGLGQSMETLSLETVESQLKALWASIPLYNLSLNLTKTSMVLLYLRLFPLRTYRIVLVIVLIFVIITGLWMVFASFFMCIPVRGAWDLSSPHNCIPKEVLWSLNAALQIITDMTIVILPMPLLAKLQLPRKQKIALILVFALGTFGCAVSIVRLAALVKMIQSTDRTKYNAAAANWSFIESSVAIICASLPTLRPIIVHICPRIFLSQDRSQSEKPACDGLYVPNPFRCQNHSYSASVTGNCSTNHEGREPSMHRHPEVDGIQVVSEVHWDLNSADNAEETHSQRGLRPSGRSFSVGRG
ncbi:hypothetical protein BDV32DRAFT_149732 [Aspergillus pseudonomiae]|uniref:Rhodopsin domain-containing protein n=1 Tax=Aspergillus pseudonomiae TaxID=1506151 RepID=A0A5N6I0I4_9EURO|nr:uncharacterized protein BDV37DRAFT_29560 [Aspergillus pseudonomiae]KAB8260251.1 hypothetical protein BDV32DRAFT_149732 [Aspergillus pseudonomiae]KAE8407251.1 hypothetical protein BDV37DRAFT_29560 [Aspergillus pseudonomiae]